MTDVNCARPSALLEELFPALGVSAYELRGTASPETLMPEEVTSCGTFRANRLSEFAAGRLCARGALGAFGVAGYAVQRNADRTPRWPDGIVGSITHTIGYCGAVAGSREHFAGLGIDAEIVARVTPDIWSQALTPDERTRMEALPPSELERAAAIAFSAKEAFYKAQSAVTGAWLDYGDVGVTIDAETHDSGTFCVRAATAAGWHVIANFEACGRYRIADGLVLTGVALAPGELKASAPLHLVAS